MAISPTIDEGTPIISVNITVIHLFGKGVLNLYILLPSLIKTSFSPAFITSFNEGTSFISIRLFKQSGKILF